MVIYLSWLICLSALIYFFTEKSSDGETLINCPANFIMHVVFGLFILLIFDFICLNLVGLESLSNGYIGFYLHTVNDLPVTALRIIWQITVSAVVVFVIRANAHRKFGIEYHVLPSVCVRAYISGISAALLLFIVSLCIESWAEDQLIINEVCSKNKSIIADAEGNYSDYIELYNSSPFQLNLSRFSVTDDLDKPAMNAADGSEYSTFISAHGYAIVWTEKGDNHFGISSDGEDTIYLLSSSGNIQDEVLIPDLADNLVYARDNSDEGWGIYYPSPMEENVMVPAHNVNPPKFSAESGFYEEEFILEINADEGCEIFYTLDGSVPNEDSIHYVNGIEVTNVCNNSNVYRNIQNVVINWKDYSPSEENVDKVFIIRAVAIDEDGICSDIVTKTYFVDMEEYHDRYVISLISDPEDLFGDNGIYVTGIKYDEWYESGNEFGQPAANFLYHGLEYEIETSIELFYNKELMSQTAGLRIQGSSNRGEPLKRFALYSREKYSGSYYFSYEFFDTNTHSFILRDDFADAFLQSLVLDRNLGGMEAVPVSIFLNGEFWYDTYIREKYSEDYLASEFGISDRSKIELLEYIPDEIFNFLNEHDLSQDDDYEEFGQLLDIQNYIDYIACNVYLCNIDMDENKNVKIWRSESGTGQGYDDGRWRFLIYDLDAIAWELNLDYYGIPSYGVNTFSVEQRFADPPYNQFIIFSSLKENEKFCRQFVLTFMDLANTYFEKGNVEKQLIEWGEDLSWCDSFFDKRFEYIVPDLAEEFGLTGTLEELTIAVELYDSYGEVNSISDLSQASLEDLITVNTVSPDLSDGSWSGYYYTDYSVTIEVESLDGYEFIGWRHNDEIYSESKIEIDLDVGENLWTAEFRSIR